MKYETTPIPVEAHQQQLVSAHVPVAPQTIATAHPGDWIIKWPDGRLEVFTDADFHAKFRTPPPPYTAIRGPHINPPEITPLTAIRGPHISFAEFPPDHPVRGDLGTVPL